MNLTITQATTATIIQTAIDSYTWHDSTYTTSGSYTFDSVNVAGCDSLTTLYLIIQPPGAISYETPNVFSVGSTITPLYTIKVPQVYKLTTVGSGFNIPLGVAVDAAENVYVAEFSYNRILKVAAVGGISSIGSGFMYPFGIALDTSGNMYVADYGNNAVKKVATDGIAVTTIGSGFNAPTGVAVDAAGNVYVADRGNNTVKKIATDGTITVLGSGFSGPAGVAVDAAGNVYVADRGNNAVKKIATDGITVTTLGGGFSDPSGVAVDAAGNVYVADRGNNAVKHIAADGVTTTALGSGFSHPNGIAVDVAGNVYVADQGNNLIKKIFLVNGPISSYSISPALPSGLSFDTLTGIVSGVATMVSPATDYTVTASNGSGSSTAVVNIEVMCMGTNSITDTGICWSALPFIWNGLTFNAAGTQTVHLTNAAGCDSAATLNLTVKSTSTSTTNLTICSNQLPFKWNGLTFNAAGTQTAHLNNKAGCDSAATLVLTVTASVTPSVSISANPSGSIVAGTTVIFTATPANGGSTPAYQWKKNGTNVGTNNTTYTDAGLVNNDVITCVMTCVMTANNSCQTASIATGNSITETVTGVQPNYVWTGTTSTNWNVANNWTNDVLPTSGVTVTIPLAVNQPSLSTDVTIAGIILNGTVAINGRSLTINGAITGTGRIKGSATSTLILNTNSNNTINFGTTATDSLLSNLTISVTGTETIGSGIGITGTLSVTAGTLNTGNHLTLKSTSILNTAVVGPVGGTITGKVTVERFIPNGLRAFRDLAAIVANAGSMLNNWQEGGNKPVGYGMYITGVKGIAPGGVDVTTGLDKTISGSASLYTYGAGNWPAVINTRNTNLDPFMGYRALVRGDRTYSLYAPDPTTMVGATILRTTGNLVTGNVLYNTTNVTSSIYTSTAAKLVSGINNYSFVANPYACPIDWELVSANAGTQNITNSYWYFDPTFMSQGYATYVTYNATPGVQINSNPSKSKLDKYIQPGMAFFIQNSNSSNPTLAITEANKAAASTKTSVFRTEAPNYIHVSLWKNINGENTNLDGAVAVFNNNFTKVIGDKDSKKLINGGENIFINQSNTDLSIAALPVPAENEEINVNLSQIVSGTTYQLQVDAKQFTTSGVEVYIKDKLLNTIVPATEGINFTATNDAASYGRFSVIFKAAKVSPVIVKGAVSIYPNPVSNGKFNLQMSNMEKGTYTVRVFNNLGQEVMNSTINNEAGTAVKTIAAKGLSVGVYTVQVVGKTGSYNTELIIKN